MRGAEDEYKRALELSPNDAAALVGFSDWLLSMGRLDEALDWIRRARELDPVGVSGTDIGVVFFHAHRYDEAIREERSALALRPNSATANWFLGMALVANGQTNEAVRCWKKHVLSAAEQAWE